VKQDHQQFKRLQFKELPAPLPSGERVIWQGKPSFKGLALRSFHIREVAIYFGLLLVWRLGSNWSNSLSLSDATTSALWLIVPALSGIAVLAALAWLVRRATCYTVTSKRILLQFGVALPVTMNIPFGKIASAALKTYRDGSGNISLKLADGGRVSYLLLWPHIRPWHLRICEPTLTSLPDAAAVAARLAEALTGQPGPSAIALASTGTVAAAADAAAHPLGTVAA
jgi:Bacterial PH domain